ncbi:uncharacterized protein BYT42DRAFT_551912 [Radiomyces spectabilis]|uniref:uncharacterized protein n=1 Tax=Radiomyces spectabilis TaxID=64574 RepID=UPI00221FA4DC|nr:uncharacterized protein BYT42DRAFT_551912 [Radiomyces spectabilis]KAI8393690.1 hypothetical protein BYT42DRAFT_551912 [Radiomyces spectabilis]
MSTVLMAASCINFSSNGHHAESQSQPMGVINLHRVKPNFFFPDTILNPWHRKNVLLFVGLYMQQSWLLALVLDRQLSPAALNFFISNDFSSSTSFFPRLKPMTSVAALTIAFARYNDPSMVLCVQVFLQSECSFSAWLAATSDRGLRGKSGRQHIQCAQT